MNRQEHIGSAVILTIPILYLFYKLNMVDNVYYIIPHVFWSSFSSIYWNLLISILIGNIIIVEKY